MHKTHQQAMGDWYFGRGLGLHWYIDDNESIDALVGCGDMAAPAPGSRVSPRVWPHTRRDSKMQPHA